MEAIFFYWLLLLHFFHVFCLVWIGFSFGDVAAFYEPGLFDFTAFITFQPPGNVLKKFCSHIYNLRAFIDLEPMKMVDGLSEYLPTS